MRSVLTSAVVVFSVLTPAPLRAVDPLDTRLLADPAVSATHVAFVYDGDLWVANLDGSGAKRLTTADGDETSPTFSPDGQQLAFSGHYDGNVDVYVMPIGGGVPERLTWHSGADVVQGFTPDGGTILFRSARQTFTGRHAQLFTVSLDGGFPERLAIPHAWHAVFSPDGSRLAYTPLDERFNQWKHYRGGTVSRIWLYERSSHAVVEIPQPEGRSNDTDPMWVGDTVYFRSDRHGEFNLFAYDVGSGTVTQRTHHEDFPIVRASAGHGRIIYEQAGYLHAFDPNQGEAKRLAIGVPAELRESRPRYVTGPRYVRAADISPSGARAVFEFRGEIVTVPAEKGDPRNITATAGVHERSPVWSPDGTRLAFFSDESGEYQLHVRSQDGRGNVETFELPGAGYYDSLSWSPDSTKLAYADNAFAYFWIDLESSVSTKFAQHSLSGPRFPQDLTLAWSPDSAWIAYSLKTETYLRRVYVHSLGTGESHAVTDGLSDVSEPVFDASGDYLYCLGSTDAGPVRQWFDLSRADMDMTSSIYLAVLRDDAPSPLAKESDEEDGEAEEPEEEDTTSEDEQDGDDTDAVEPVEIDFDHLDQRIIAVPLPPRPYTNLQAGEEGVVYFLERPEIPNNPGATPAGPLKRFSLETRESEEVVADVTSYRLSADHKKVLYRSGEQWFIQPSEKIEPGEGTLDVDAISVRIEPRAEWQQIFNEAWRINRDYFYATNYHGVDWPKMRDKYARFLPHVATRADLNRIMQWLLSELAVGHSYLFGGDRLEQPERVAGGLLGADYVVDEGRYRFAKVFGGLNWNPDLRAPLTEPGVGVREGEYLLAVNGRELLAATNIFSQFENTADKIVEIAVGPNADGSDARTVSVVPVANEAQLRNRDWVEGNLRKVNAATDGRVAYVYVPNTAGSGHEYFKRYFYPQAHKDAIIIDERFNGGGFLADYYIDHLRKQEVAYWHMRYGSELKTPSASIQGPKVMIIDETAGSGGDLLPWMFRKFGLGLLVGQRTWGGLVGMLGFPILMDGGVVTAPNLAIWTDDGWIVENVGVPPDIEVQQWPADVIAGRDPQLEKAIEVVMEELRRNAPVKPTRPPYPVRNPPSAPQR